MNADLIIKLNELIDTLNSKQQDIARNLIIDKNFLIMDSTYNRHRDIYIKNLKTNEVHVFLMYVRSKCNCE